ncbi:MAG: hypothetical protein ABI621_04370 [Chloroflexota bacterium]
MKTTPILAPNQTVAEVVQKYPETIHTWIALKTDCVGCHLMQFCSLEYVAESYNIKLETLIGELEMAIKQACSKI